MAATFRSLRERNYRLWFAGSLASNVGTWMQRTAQDWIVLTELTDNDATAVGITMALQFGPQLLLAPYAGLLADRFPKRRLLLCTQIASGVLALGLGLLVVSGTAQLWMVYCFALALGVVASLDAPARQSFVSEIVDRELLSNAIALNSTSFNSARLVGPAIAGLLTVAVGAGPVFLINAATFAFTIVALVAMRGGELHPAPRQPRARGQIREGLRYVAGRPDLIAVLVAIFVFGMLGLNFAIFTSTMATIGFGLQADAFGLLNSVIAIGSLSGALVAARRTHARFRSFIVSLVAFGVFCAIAAAMPWYWLFAIALVPVGFCSITAMNTANALVQERIDPAVRGRVMALYMAILMGGTPIGAPLMGWFVELVGPRWTLAIGGASGVVAALLAIAILRRAGQVRWRDFPWLHRPPHDEPVVPDDRAVNPD
ncbi:MFS transporter [Pseudoclavibacter chungangensis]|uniref:MFS transporter n=1 Tax=Pseudoclavibacter chungangensis TaxID=587635 RepID=A0A7J5BYT4_9MICO|nr:MFS transporter [Pseudoclavibacter chungangensis]KAB1659516.1 MFS transporter [Pseudoclavibacter chungangensis]NYJ67621.1 MFS family permease [Pseudoclavibacter chungangensis]